ncbi:aspartyl/asparaginyl beta-hydroxylase domain-containing protein [Bradyrhizobium japonicum]|uniref:aspartyl/asparaginyl beta-hydroxylase domain-containing protein n=1 Tax=Bradyrhizobium japonicum TaxID=375 RepID=UPI003D9B9DD7
MSREAAALKRHFRPHRDVPGWASLGLRTLRGNPTYTEAEAKYGFTPQPSSQFAQTPFADSCPTIMRAVSKIVDVDRCRRIRILALEVGAKIPCHRDEVGPVAIVTHLPLTYDRGCRFMVGLSPTGARSATTSSVPVRNGAPMLINVAAYHSVENNSKRVRYSVIMEGPLLASTTELLALARSVHKRSIAKQVMK